MIRLMFAIAAVLSLLSGCTTSDTLSARQIAAASASESQPRYATYNCGRGRSLTIENFRTSVIVVPPTGESVELIAAPPGSLTRYSEGQDTLVLDKRSAFWFRTGKDPLDCKR